MSTHCLTCSIFDLDVLREQYEREHGPATNRNHFGQFLEEKTGMLPMYNASNHMDYTFTWCFDNEADALQFKLTHLV